MWTEKIKLEAIFSQSDRHFPVCSHLPGFHQCCSSSSDRTISAINTHLHVFFVFSLSAFHLFTLMWIGLLVRFFGCLFFFEHALKHYSSLKRPRNPLMSLFPIFHTTPERCTRCTCLASFWLSLLFHLSILSSPQNFEFISLTCISIQFTTSYFFSSTFSG